MTGNRIKRPTNDENDNMLLAADIGLAFETNLAVIATLGSQIKILERRLQGRVKSSAASAPGAGQTLATSFFSIGSPTLATLRPRALRQQCAHQQSQGKGAGKLKQSNKDLALGIRRGREFTVRLCSEANRFLERKKAGTNDILVTKVPASSWRAGAVTF